MFLEDPNLLVIILDTNPYQWAKCPLKFSKALESITVFLNAYLALKPQNQLAIIATTVDSWYATGNQDPFCRQCICVYGTYLMIWFLLKCYP